MGSEPHIELGPVPAEAVRAFVAFARPEMERLAGSTALPETFTPSMRRSIQALFDAWDDAAHDETFSWSGNLPTDHAEYLLYALLLAVEHRRADLGGAPTGPDVAARRPFVLELITRFTAALAATPDADQERLAHLSERWPRDLRR